MVERDDLDALKEKVVAQERELGDLRAALRDKTRELEALKAQRAPIPHARPTRRWASPTAIGAAALLGGLSLGLGFVTCVSGPFEKPALVVVGPPTSVLAPLPPAPPSPPPPVVVDAKWRARVISARGAPITSGSACEARARLVSDGGPIRVEHVTVTCGDHTLYALAAPPSATASQWPGPDATSYRFNLHVLDAGASSPPGAEDAPLHATLTSWGATSRIWNDDIDVHLALEPLTDAIALARPPSRPVAASYRDYVVRPGRVTSSRGMRALSRGAMCTVAVAPASPRPADLDCRVLVRCGGNVLYGVREPLHKGAEDACSTTPNRVRDLAPSTEDADPQLDLDLTSGRVLVEDGATRVEITLDAAASARR